MSEDTKFSVNLDLQAPGAALVQAATDKVSQMLQLMMEEQDEEGIIYDSEA